jgi:serine/threonine protein kinase
MVTNIEIGPRYCILERVGGGMADVYSALDTQFQRKVAVKIVTANGGFSDKIIDRFRHEAQTIAQLDYPLIVPLLDYGEDAKKRMLYMVMPYCEEEDFATWLSKQTQNGVHLLPLEDVAHFLHLAAEALQYIHNQDRGIIHRDVKPSNFLMQSQSLHGNPNRPYLRLTDFGIAKFIADPTTQLIGSPSYMSPEQWANTGIDQRSDQYALGIMTYELLTGHVPFSGNDILDLARQHCNAPPPPLGRDDLSTDIERVVLRSLKKKQKDRFPSVSEFDRAFQQAVSNLKKQKTIVTPPKPVIPRWIKIIAIANILLLIVLLAASCVFIYSVNTVGPPCEKPLDLSCSTGIGITSLSVGQESNITIGIIDEYTGKSFNQSDPTEKDLEAKIFEEDKNVADAVSHFTLVVATTLSKTESDGLSASVGYEDLRGAYLAQHFYNERHAIKLRLIIANLGLKSTAQVTVPLVAAQIVLLAKKAPINAHFIGVVGFPFSITATEALPLLQQNDILVISSSASSDALSNERDFYRIEPPDSKQNQYIQKFIQEELKPQRVVVLYDSTDPYSNSLGTNVTQGLNKTNIDVSTLSYTVGHPDTLPGPSILTSMRPDLLFFAGYPDDLDALKENLKGISLLQNMRIMGAQALYEVGGYKPCNSNSKDCNQVGDNNYSSLYFTSFAFHNSLDANSRFFQNIYSITFNSDHKHDGQYGFDIAGPHSLLLYDSIGAYLEAVRQAGDASTPSLDKIRAALKDPSFHFDGATGRTTFNQDAKAPSDPGDKSLYVLCTNLKGHTHAIFEYSPNSEEQPKSMESQEACSSST